MDPRCPRRLCQSAKVLESVNFWFTIECASIALIFVQYNPEDNAGNFSTTHVCPETFSVITRYSRPISLNCLYVKIIFTNIFKTQQTSPRSRREYSIIYCEFCSFGQNYNGFPKVLNQICTIRNCSNIYTAHTQMRKIFLVFEYCVCSATKSIKQMSS